MNSISHLICHHLYNHFQSYCCIGKVFFVSDVLGKEIDPIFILSRFFLEALCLVSVIKISAIPILIVAFTYWSKSLIIRKWTKHYAQRCGMHHKATRNRGSPFINIFTNKLLVKSNIDMLIAQYWRYEVWEHSLLSSLSSSNPCSLRVNLNRIAKELSSIFSSRSRCLKGKMQTCSLHQKL